MRFVRLNIPTRIYAGFGLVSLVGLAVAGNGIYQMSRIAQQQTAMSGFAASLMRNQDTSLNLESIRRAETRFRLDADQPAWEDLTRQEAQARSRLKAAQATRSEERRQIYLRVEDGLRVHDESLAKFRTLVKQANDTLAGMFKQGDVVTAGTNKLVAGASNERERALAAKVETAILVMRVVNLRFQAVNDRAGPVAFKRALDAASDAVTTFTPAASAEEQSVATELNADLASYGISFAISAEARLTSNDIFEQQLSPQIQAMQKNLDGAGVSLKQAYDSAEAETSDLMGVTTLLGEVLAAVGAVLSAGLAFLIGRGIARPLTAMTRAMSSLATGVTDLIIPGVGRRDEIGTMAGAVQVFKVAGIEKLRLEAEALEQARATEAERARVEAERSEKAEQQEVVVEDLASALARLARGDLTCTLTRSFSSQYEGLRSDFNTAVEALNGAIGAVVIATAGIRAGTGEVALAAADLSRRTEHQAASLEQTAAALDQITTTVRKTADCAMQASLVVARIKTDAKQSGDVVHQSVDAMSSIEQSSKKISQIISVIDEIAFQTNLLALNAGVEAARAGDSGRGFAVVASEVRALAQRTAEAAKEIKALISTSVKQVDGGVKLVGQAGESLERIATQVNEIATAVTEMAASAREQSIGLLEVNTAINQMDQVTQQNAAMGEQSTAANQSLDRETAELVLLTERFTLVATKGGNAVESPASRVEEVTPNRTVRRSGRLNGGPAQRTRFG